MTEVAIDLQTALNVQGEWEYYNVQATGQLYHKDAMDVLIFTEATDAGSVKNMVTIQPDKVSIKRSGALVMHQQFKLHQPTENILHHPYTTVYMDTYTHSIGYDADSGRLTIAYSVRLNGQDPRSQHLKLFINSSEYPEEAPT